MNQKHFMDLYHKLADISEEGSDIFNSEAFIAFAKEETKKSEDEIWEDVTKIQLGQERFADLLKGMENHRVDEDIISAMIQKMVAMRLKPYHGIERHRMLLEFISAGKRMLDEDLTERELIRLNRVSIDTLEIRLEHVIRNILERLWEDSSNMSLETVEEEVQESEAADDISQGAFAGGLYMESDLVQKTPECAGYLAEMLEQCKLLGEKLLDGVELIAKLVLIFACCFILALLALSALAFAGEILGYTVAYIFEIPWLKVVESFVWHMSLFSKEIKALLGAAAGAGVLVGAFSIIKKVFVKNKAEIKSAKDTNLDVTADKETEVHSEVGAESESKVNQKIEEDEYTEEDNMMDRIYI